MQFKLETLCTIVTCGEVTVNVHNYMVLVLQVPQLPAFRLGLSSASLPKQSYRSVNRHADPEIQNQTEVQLKRPVPSGSRQDRRQQKKVDGIANENGHQRTQESSRFQENLTRSTQYSVPPILISVYQRSSAAQGVLPGCRL